MTIVFFSNFINHHQVGVADELYRLTDGNYYFVCTQEMPESFRRTGYPDYSSRPYVIKAYNGGKSYEKALCLAGSADVAIFGGHGGVSKFRDIRLKTNFLSFEYGERWLKKGMINVLSPRFIKFFFKYHFLYSKRRYYALCASAYAAGDLNKFAMFRNKCYKWGYFTEVNDIDEDCFKKMKSNFLSVMWCSRFIEWKHPEIPILVANKLRLLNIPVIVDMFGSGPMENSIVSLINKYNLQDYICLKGNLPNDEIKKQMQNHDIFLFTSDQNEGWGAVANEAMSNGCVVVGDEKIGSIPFLIKHGVNGRIYKKRNVQTIVEQILCYYHNPQIMEMNSKEAYRTMRDIWSPQNAALNFFTVAYNLLNGNNYYIKEGPMSVAREI